MPFTISIEVDAAETIQMLENMKLRSTNFKPIFWYAEKELKLANAANFTSSGLPVGGWAPRDGESSYAWPLMIRTGKLFQSLSTLRGAPNNIDRMEATFGTNVEYAKFHQFGTRNMPKRQVVFEPPLFAKRLGVAAAKYVTDGLVPGDG